MAWVCHFCERSISDGGKSCANSGLQTFSFFKGFWMDLFHPCHLPAMTRSTQFQTGCNISPKTLCKCYRLHYVLDTHMLRSGECVGVAFVTTTGPCSTIAQVVFLFDVFQGPQNKAGKSLSSPDSPQLSAGNVRKVKKNAQKMKQTKGAAFIFQERNGRVCC